jgi:D-threonate/D-erythronate kinase
MSNADMKIRVITDDFSSAVDGLGPFASRGWHTQVCCTSPYTEADIASTNTDSRTLRADEAQVRVATWAKAWRSADVLVKQIDSTLRGPLAQEVLAALQASGRTKLLIAPAFPAAGRTTHGGRVFVHGLAVDQTAFSRDPLNPVRQSSVPELFAELGVSVAVAKSPRHALRELETHRAVLMDADHEDDLKQLVHALHHRTDLLWAGSTGLMHAMANALPGRAGSERQIARAARPALVVGSFNPQSREQLAHLRTQRPDALVWTTPDVRANSGQVTAHLVDEVIQAVEQKRCDGLVITGGETAAQIAKP